MRINFVTLGSALLILGMSHSPSHAGVLGDTARDLGSSTPVVAYASASADQSGQSGQSGSAQYQLPPALQGLKIGGVFYLSYQNGKKGTGTGDNTTPYNQFVLTRGYLDVQKKLTPYLMGRYTTDITRDSFGDWKTRIKYLYGKFSAKGNSVFSGLGMEWGQIHNPWLDFEESINGFRMQGTMFLERSGIFNSADVGVMVSSDLGGKVSEDYRKNVNGHYSGRYGTWQFGVYNGGGYHAPEKNLNKVMEGRLTVRPLPDQLPGLQASVLGMYGKGNVASDGPDFQVFDGMLSYQSVYFTGTGQLYLGKGNAGGSAVNSSGDALKRRGFSAFAAAHVAKENRVSIIGRFDYFDGDTDNDNNDVQKRVIGGLAYNMSHGNTVLLDYENVNHSTDGYANDQQFQTTLQIVF